MSKKAFSKIAEGLGEALEIASGRAEPARLFVPSDVDVRAIRRDLHMTQTEFAASFGFPLTTLRDWEQKRSRPDSAARTLLMVIKREPEAVGRALSDPPKQR